MASIAESLRALRDVQGVYGSFVVASSGSLVSRDLPDAFDEDLLGEVGPRLVRLCEAFASAGAEPQSVLLRYAEHKLFVRKVAWGIIVVVSGLELTLPALRMVLNLIARRIDPEGPAAPPRPSTPLARMAAAQTARSAPPPRFPSSSPADGELPPAGPSQAAAPAAHEVEAARPQDGRDSNPAINERHVRMYRGRVVEE